MMLRRIVLAALLLALAPGYALAQQAWTAPYAPLTANDSRIANTKWVNDFLAGGIPLASGKIFIGNASNIATAQSMSGDCTLVASGVITCTQAAGNFQVIGNLTVGGSIIDGNGILATNIVAPATPAAGTTRIYVDSTTKTLSSKNDAGTVSNTVVASLAVANQFMTGISAAGVITRAQPAFSDLSGSTTCAQLPALTGDISTSAGACATAIGANKVTRAMQAQGIARSVIGVTGNAGANVADIQGTANQFLGVNSAGTALAFTTMSQDCVLATGVITCTKTNNVSFAASATTDTTNAANISSGTLPAARTNGHQNGTATNDNGAAGEVGEYICLQVTNGGSPTGCVTNTNTPVSVTTGTAANVGSLSITAGDWDICGNVVFQPAAGTTQSANIAWISTVSATLPTPPNGGAYTQQSVSVAASATMALYAGCIRYSFASTTTVYLSGLVNFAVSTETIYGFMTARRRR